MQPILFTIDKIRRHSWRGNAGRRYSEDAWILAQSSCFGGIAIKLNFSGKRIRSSHGEQERNVDCSAHSDPFEGRWRIVSTIRQLASVVPSLLD